MRKLLALAAAVLVLSPAWSADTLLVDGFENMSDWSWSKNRGGTAELSGFALNGSSLRLRNPSGYGDVLEKEFKVSAQNLENYEVSVWFYNNNSYTNVDIYLVDDSGVECSNSINSGFRTHSWNQFVLRIGDFEKCDYQSLTSIDRVQLYIGESPADIYLDDLEITTSDEPLEPGDGGDSYEQGVITIDDFNISASVVRRGEPVLFTAVVSSETGVSSVSLDVAGNSFAMYRSSGNEHQGTYVKTYYPASNDAGTYSASAAATDLGGNTTSSADLEFAVDPDLDVSLDTSGPVPYQDLLDLYGVADSAGEPVNYFLELSGNGWNHAESFQDQAEFFHQVNTSIGMPGSWTITLKAVDLYNNSGTNSTSTYVNSFENDVLDVLLVEPVGGEFQAGEVMNITAEVKQDREYVSDAVVEATVGGSPVAMEGNGVYTAEYQIPWDAPEGWADLFVEAVRGQDGGTNSTQIWVVQPELEGEVEGGSGIVGSPGTVTVTIEFNDSTSARNATLVGSVGDENVTFVEVEPGVYQANYTPKGNETEMVVTGPGGFSYVYTFTSRYPTVFEYWADYLWLIVIGGVAMATGIILIRRRNR